MEIFGNNKMNSIMDAIKWVCAYFQENDDRNPEFSWMVQETKILEALNNDVDVPCVVQGWMWWYSPPTSPNNDLLNDGVLLAKYEETINLAIKGSFILPFWRRNTPRSGFLRAQCLTMTGMPEWVWAPERELKGWDVGGTPDLLPESEDDGQDIQPDKKAVTT